jgi:hypothetical protein
MKEYKITMTFTIEAVESNYDKIVDFADELADKIIESEELIINDDISIVDTDVDNIEDLSSEDEEYEEYDD